MAQRQSRSAKHWQHLSRLLRYGHLFAIFQDRSLLTILVSMRSALERTYLTYLRLGLVLISLSGSILCQLRFPGPSGPPIHLSTSEAFPLGIAYGIASVTVLFAGLCWYQRGCHGLRIGKAFVNGDLGCVRRLPSSGVLFNSESQLRSTRLGETAVCPQAS